MIKFEIFKDIHYIHKFLFNLYSINKINYFYNIMLYKSLLVIFAIY